LYQRKSPWYGPPIAQPNPKESGHSTPPIAVMAVAADIPILQASL